MNRSEPSETTIAIVMPAHRAGPDLDASVTSVEALDPPPHEYVVVVDGGDPAVVDRVGPSHSVVEIEQSGPAAARNAGVRETTTDVVLFIDSDIVVPTDLIACVREAMEGPGGARSAPDAVIGSYDDAPAAPATVSQFRNLLHHWTHHQAAGPGHTFWAGCGAVRRTAFDAVGGFDERYRDATIEDIEFGERLTAAGFSIEIVPTIEVKHLKAWTLRSMVHTDVTKRGVPWSRLMLRHGAIADDLNTTRAARVTVSLVGVLVTTTTLALTSRLTSRVTSRVARRWASISAIAIAALLVWRDRDFLGYLRRKRSIGFAARSVPLMWIHHLSAGASFAWALATWPIEKRRTT